MCIGDWRLGRLISMNQKAFALTFGSSLILNPNRQRVGVGVYLDQELDTGFNITTTGGPLPAQTIGNAALQDFNTLDVAIDGFVGVMLSCFSPRFECNLLTHGPLPMHKFTLTVPQNDVVGMVVEYFLPEEYLTAATESFKQEYQPWLK